MSTVLVVEDDRDIREVVRRSLERARFAVLTTASGVEALRLLDDSVVDLVVLDLGLPDVDGTEVMREARQGRRTPVVVLTARSAVDDRAALERVAVVVRRRPPAGRHRPGHRAGRRAAHRADGDGVGPPRHAHVGAGAGAATVSRPARH